MFADIAQKQLLARIQWQFQAVGPRAHESSGKQILHACIARGEKQFGWTKRLETKSVTKTRWVEIQEE